MKAFLLLLALSQLARPGTSLEVRGESGRFWIASDSASVQEVLQEIAAISPMELWLDESASEKRVTVRIEGLPLRETLEKLFEASGLNFVFYSDARQKQPVVKLYAGTGGGAGRLAPKPALDPAAKAGDPIPPELADWIFQLHGDDVASSTEEDREPLQDFLQLLAEARGVDESVDDDPKEPELVDPIPAELLDVMNVLRPPLSLPPDPQK